MKTLFVPHVRFILVALVAGTVVTAALVLTTAAAASATTPAALLTRHSPLLLSPLVVGPALHALISP